MAKEQDDFQAANASVIAKWTRDKERAELSAEHAEKQTAKAIANLLKSQTNRVNIAKDLKAATENTKPISREGFGAMDELITGWEERPWDRDINE